MLVVFVREDVGIGGVFRFRGELFSFILFIFNFFLKGVFEGKVCSFFGF